MRATSLLLHLLGLKHLLVRGCELLATELIVDVRPRTRVPRCSGCLWRVHAGYDRRVRTWRHLDFAGLTVRLRYALRRVDCPRCGVVSELVPWAEHDSGFTRPFEEGVAWMTQRMDRTSVCTWMGIAWATVGRIAARVVRRLGPSDRLEGLTRIGIDELSYRKHHKYLTVVTDHLGGRIVWVGEGRTGDTLRGFFAELGKERSGRLEVVTLDMSESYIGVVREEAPQARLVFDRFHVQRLAQDALDTVRRGQVRENKGTEKGKAIKRTRWILQKRPWKLDPESGERLSAIQKSNRLLYRAYLLKESLANLLDYASPQSARMMLGQWRSWASRSGLPPFRKVSKTLGRYADGVLAYVETGMSNGRAEGMNGKVRVITKRAYGFHEASSLIGLIFLCCSGLVLRPPRRQ